MQITFGSKTHLYLWIYNPQLHGDVLTKILGVIAKLYTRKKALGFDGMSENRVNSLFLSSIAVRNMPMPMKSFSPEI